MYCTHEHHILCLGKNVMQPENMMGVNINTNVYAIFRIHKMQYSYHINEYNISKLNVVTYSFDNDVLSYSHHRPVC